MPNNPGRIEGDYSIGEKEEVKYVDPPKGFGVVKGSSSMNWKYIAAAIVIVIIALLIIFR